MFRLHPGRKVYARCPCRLDREIAVDKGADNFTEQPAVTALDLVRAQTNGR